MQIRRYQPEDENAVITLWEQCGLTRSWNDPRKDIQRKMSMQPEWFLVGILDRQVVATVMVGYDGHRGSAYYLGVAPEHREKGLGRALMAEAERLLKEAGCPKVNLQVRSENRTVIEFYRQIGYSVDDVVGLRKRLIPDQTDNAEPGATAELFVSPL